MTGITRITIGELHTRGQRRRGAFGGNERGSGHRPRATGPWGPFHHQPPSELELESAIAFVELAASACGGSAAAFEAIVRRHNRLLFRTARGVVPDDAEAQDVVQETYLRAFLHLQSFRGESSLGTWLARIAINVALSWQRKKGRLVSLAERDEGMDGSFAQGRPDT